MRGTRVHVQALHNARHHPANVAVRDHCPLGFSGGSGGIDHQPDVVECLHFQGRVDPLQITLLRSQLLDFLERHNHGALLGSEAAQALGFHDDDLAQLGQVGQGLEQFIGLLLVFTDHDFNVGMAHHVRHFRRGASGVDAHGDATDQAGAHLRQHPFDAVLCNHAHMAACAQTDAAQPHAKVAGALVVAGPGEGLPDAKVFLPNGDALRVAAGAFAQHLG